MATVKSGGKGVAYNWQQLLSFAFAANSPEQLKVLAETMKTVQFY